MLVKIMHGYATPLFRSNNTSILSPISLIAFQTPPQLCTSIYCIPLTFLENVCMNALKCNKTYRELDRYKKCSYLHLNATKAFIWQLSCTFPFFSLLLFISCHKALYKAMCACVKKVCSDARACMRRSLHMRNIFYTCMLL